MGRKGEGQETGRLVPCEEDLACTSYALFLSCFHMCLCAFSSTSFCISLLFFLSFAPFILPTPGDPHTSKQPNVLQPLNPEAGRRKALEGVLGNLAWVACWALDRPSQAVGSGTPTPNSTGHGLSPLEPLGKLLRRLQGS